LTGGKYNPRRIIQEAILGLENKLMDAQDSNIWACSTCQKCVELCPQKVGLTDIFVLIKNKYFSRGQAPEPFLLQASSVFENGVAIPYSRPIIQRREKLGLPEIKTAEVQEIKTLLMNINFDSQLPKKVANP
jgi:heterodisulfide reductase subunit C